MTGHGQSLVQTEAMRVLAEVKSVNNRFLKTHLHADLNVNRQAEIEALIKRTISRGTVNLKIKIERLLEQDSYRINAAVVRSYWIQLAEIAGNSQHVNIESLLQLPGVIDESLTSDDSDVWPVVVQATKEALDQMQQMRRQEGEAMKVNMLDNCKEIEKHLQSIRQLAPKVVAAYETRLAERIKMLLEKYEATVQVVDIVKEVGIYAERSDISEEVVRLGSHLQQFRELCDGAENGRTLDFLVQEMLRETNTIGSKASNSEIGSSVIAIKTMIERIREMVQNVE
jgi:uncharacterized protein (TIGR00255 family)